MLKLFRIELTADSNEAALDARDDRETNYILNKALQNSQDAFDE